MNTPRMPRATGPRPVDEQDWRAQERAIAAPSGDPRDALLARALRTLPVSQPPDGFAAEVAALAAAGARVDTEADGGLERILLRVLLLLLSRVAAGALAYYGGGWWAAARSALGAGAAQWAFAGLACLLMSALPPLARRVAVPATA